MILVDGVIVDGDGYQRVCEEMQARRPMKGTLLRHRLTPEEYGEIGRLAFGGDEFNQVLFALRAQEDPPGTPLEEEN